jgi:hypothetical protein
MKLHLHSLGLILLALPVALPAATPPAAPPAASTSVTPATPPKTSVPNPLAPRFKQVRDRIEVLFQNRNDVPPPLEPRFNPFRSPTAPAAPTLATAPLPTVGTANAEGASTSPVPPPPANTNLATLQQAVATLKVSGVFEITGKSHLVINARPYKEGDVVQTLVAGETIYLRVREISKRSVTLVLNDAEMTLRF